MARQKIREFDAKKLIFKELGYEFKKILIDQTTNLDKIAEENPWLLYEKLAIKPDMLFNKKAKNNLILININFEEATKYIKEKINEEITLGKSKDKLTHFIIEPFIEHKEEYYLAFISNRDGCEILFSAEGGIDIEEKWESLTRIQIKISDGLDEISLNSLNMNLMLSTKINKLHQNIIINFIKEIYYVYIKEHFTYLEINPFTVDNEGTIKLLGVLGEVDDCSLVWKNFDFPKLFGQKYFPEEEFIRSLDKESGASLKLTILNPKGRIWNILSGGGASILYLDAIFEIGKPEEIANYGEYSGNPTTEETYQYAKTIIGLMTKETHSDGKVLIIGGAIANFTDVEKTFLGIIKALKEYQEPLRKGKISIFVRRGGPNYEKGLSLMETTGKELGISMLVHGPDFPMIDIVTKAIGALK